MTSPAISYSFAQQVPGGVEPRQYRQPGGRLRTIAGADRSGMNPKVLSSPDLTASTTRVAVGGIPCTCYYAPLLFATIYST
jgi:hypothetical protein